MSFTPLILQTIEDSLAEERAYPLVPERNEPFTLFHLNDPFGVRRAIIPLFWTEPDGHILGLGTAFAADPWGTFLTADHVMEEARKRSGPVHMSGGDFHTMAPQDAGVIGILGFGLVFGHVGLPRSAVAHLLSSQSPVLPGNDPLMRLQRKPDFRPLDLAVLRMTLPGAKVHNLQIRRSAQLPKVGDAVVAIGFPDVRTFRGTEADAVTTIQEGMKVAYGRVSKILLEGRDASNPTPVFEVAANWPSGMSGGPVFNMNGEAVGLVSRSYLPEDGNSIGTAWATYLGILSQMANYVPTLDPVNLTWRRGWGVFDQNGLIIEMFATEEEACSKHPTITPVYISWRVGTQDYIMEQAG